MLKASRRLAVVSLACAILVAALAATGAVGQEERYEPAPLVVWGRQIAVFRVPFGSITPAERARNSQRRIEELPLDLLTGEIQINETTVGGLHGVLVTAAGAGTLLGIADGDLDPLAGETLESAGEHARAQLRGVFDARLEQRRPSTILRAVGVAIAVALAMAVLFLVDGRVRRGAARRLERLSPSASARVLGIDLRPALFSVVRVAIDAAAWAVRILLLYLALIVILRQMPYTRAWAERLGGAFGDLVGELGAKAIYALPGLLAAVVIFVATRLVTRGVDRVLQSVEEGQVALSWLHADTVPATRRIVKIALWLLGISIAYPYLPGSNTAAFKGVSVFAGAMLTLGSTGLVTQLMSGLVLIYSRALKPGDLVQVGGTYGFVTDVGILSTKLRTPRGEQITIPNAVMIGNQVTNFVDEAMLSTTVTIGYDAPWRQVHGLLLLAAERTLGLRREPAPYVVQRALSDFYVEYELRAHLERPMERIATLSVLHSQIQDAFNEFGVQIMSPHFEGQPEKTVVVPRDAWHARPSPPGDSAARRP